MKLKSLIFIYINKKILNVLIKRKAPYYKILNRSQILDKYINDYMSSQLNN